MAKKKKVYAYYFVDTGRSGMCDKWSECENIVKGSKSRYKGFSSKLEAKEWLDSGANYEPKPKKVYAPLREGIYFDAGTGRGNGTEVRVTRKDGESIVHNVVPADKINEFGNYYCHDGATNNFGELLGCYIALKIAIKEGEMEIFGDSKLVIEYWSKGHIKKDSLPEKTVELSYKVNKLRKEFEKSGGVISHISGDINPADLGFHK